MALWRKKYLKFGDFFLTALVWGQKIKKIIVFYTLVYTWAFHNLKEKVKNCVFKCVKIRKENYLANAIAPTVDVTKESKHSKFVYLVSNIHDNVFFCWDFYRKSSFTFFILTEFCTVTDTVGSEDHIEPFCKISERWYSRPVQVTCNLC
jgi:hypothetical protein